MPPNPAPGINPVALTYTPSPAATGSTAASIPHPEPISSKIYHIAGMVVTVYGLEELSPDWTEVGVLWLLHPRLQTQECMAPFAAHIIASWNTHTRSAGSAGSSGGAGDKKKKGLIAVSFDQRNHGSREVNALANEAWRGGNETHAQDMFSCFQGTAADTSQLIDYLPGYIFPNLGTEQPSQSGNRRRIGPHIALGVSLGGHAAWQCLLHDPRITAAIVTIGCPDYERVMSDRARLSKRKTWLDGNGAHFIGSPDFPPSLVSSVRRWDPAGYIFGTLRDQAGRAKGQEHLFPYTPSELAVLNPVMQQSFSNKRVLCLSGGADRLVPYKHSEPFMQWLKTATGPGGFFEHGHFDVQDVVLPGVGHDVPPKMVEYMIPFVIDTLDNNNNNNNNITVGGSGSGSSSGGGTGTKDAKI